MTSIKRLAVSVFAVLWLAAGCAKHETPQETIQPAKVSPPSDSSGIALVELTADARERLGIKSLTFARNPQGRFSVPVSALIYSNDGSAWVFVEPAPRLFRREPIKVLATQAHRIQIEIQNSFPESIPIVTVGAAELYGTEAGIGK